jgi:hypothetical protein
MNQLSPGRQHLMSEVYECLGEIRKKSLEKKADLGKSFQKYDKQDLGFVNGVVFNYVMDTELGIPASFTKPLRQALDPANADKLPYLKFISLYHNPSGVEELPVFQELKEWKNKAQTKEITIDDKEKKIMQDLVWNQTVLDPEMIRNVQRVKENPNNKFNQSKFFLRS